MCVLRVTGSTFEPEEFLRTSALRPCSVFKAGAPRIASSPEEPVSPTSGFTVPVSDAAWSDLAGQTSDACRFLERHGAELHALSRMAAVEDIWLAFAIELRIGRDNVVAQCDYFPPDLVRAAGILGIGIELSTYACCENPGPQPRDGFTGSAGNEN